MKQFLRILAALLCSLTASALWADEPALRIATFEIDATPPLGSPLCNGGVTPAMKIDSPLTARGVVLLGAGEPIVLCAFDWVGIGNGSYDAFRDALAAAVGTTADRVALHTLHQHDAPGSDFETERLLAEYDLAGEYSNPDFDSDVLRRLAATAKRAVGQPDAVFPDAASPDTETRSPRAVTHVGFGTGTVEKVASNRRILGDDGQVVLQRQSSGGKNPRARDAPEGTIDPLVRLISFWNDDEPLAVLTYYATHPQSYYGRGGVNWDFVGMARAAREDALPGLPHIHFNGAGGNVAAGKYNDGSESNRPILAERLAAGMQAAWDNQKKHTLRAEDVVWRVDRVALPVRGSLVEEELLARLQDTSEKLKSRLRAARDLAFVRRMNQGHQISLSCLQIGDACVLHMPGELFVEYQLAAQQMRPNDFVAMAAYGDYGPGYIGTRIAYSQGGYETGIVSRVDPAVEDVLTNATKRLLNVERDEAAIPDETDASGKPATPNFLLITCDNLGYGDLSCFNPNSAVQTPHLNRLAADGIRLTSFYTASPTCTVSRACLLTGRIPQRHGLQRQLPGIEGNYGIGLNQEETLLPAMLKLAPVPYVTGCFGKWNIGFAPGSRPTERGFDEFIGHASGNMDYYHHNYREKHDLYHGVEELHREGEYATDLFADAAAAFIRRHSDRPTPWFCYVPFNAPHFPVAGNKRFGQPCRYQAPDAAFQAIGLSPDETDPRKRYEAVVFALDAAIGRVLAALDAAGQRDNTFVFFMSDNGAFRLDREGLDVGINDPLRSGGVTCWEGGLRVPAIARWPGRIETGSTTDAALWSPDVFTACTRLANARLPNDLVFDGKNPLPTLTRAAESPHESLIFEYQNHAALRQGDWKIVRERPDFDWQLFNLREDIGESCDVASANPGRLRELSAEFQRWKRTLPPRHESREGKTSKSSAAQGNDGVAHVEGLVYKTVDGVPLKMDLAHPDGAGPYPAIVFIHGGGWYMGDRHGYRDQIIEAARQGYVGVTIDYRLMSFVESEKETTTASTRFPAQVHDAKAAVRWLRQNADRFRIDPDRIGATGRSAGGHLSLMLGLTDRSDGFEEDALEHSSRVQAVVNVFGPTELTECHENSSLHWIFRLFAGGTPDQVPDTYRLASPLTWVTKDDPPVLTLHGDQDQAVPFNQAQKLDVAMQSVGAPHTLITFDGQRHGFGGEYRERELDLMWRFFDQHLKPE